MPAVLSRTEWAELEARSGARRRGRPRRGARARQSRPVRASAGSSTPTSDAEAPEAIGGLPRDRARKLGGSDDPDGDGEQLRFAEAVRRTLRHELDGESAGCWSSARTSARKGGVHLVTEGLQRKHGDARVFDTSLSEEGIIGRAVGMAIAGSMPVAEIQFRKYADPAAEQLNNCGTMRWRTANRFCAPIVVRMPGGFGKDVGDPVAQSLSAEVQWAHAIGWQVAMPSNAADAVGLLRAAMRGAQPDDLLRASIAADDERRQRALSRRRLRHPVRLGARRSRGN